MLTPGVYHLNAPLFVARKDTVMLGLGMPSLTPDNGTAAIRIADVDGVRDRRPDRRRRDRRTRRRWSTSAACSATGRHAGDPISLQDVFFRVGGPWLGKATTSLVVNSDDTMLDDIWAWRADHGNGVGWTANTAANGVVVNGDNVTAYGLFVEHYPEVPDGLERPERRPDDLLPERNAVRPAEPGRVEHHRPATGRPPTRSAPG